MIRRAGDRDRLALGVAGADPYRELELVIELATRAIARRGLVRQLALAKGPPDRHIRRPHRGGAAVIGDRHIFVIGAERVVRVAPAPAVPRMMDTGKEIGEFADRGRQMHRALGGRVQQPRGKGFELGALGAVGGQEGGEPFAQHGARPGAERHQRVQRRPRCRLGRLPGIARKQPRFECRAEIEDHVADRDPAARRAACRAEDAERQILYRKLGMPIRRGNPTAAPRIMGLVDPAHHSSVVRSPSANSAAARSSLFPPPKARRK